MGDRNLNAHINIQKSLITGMCLCVCLSGCAKHKEQAGPETLIRAGWDYYRLGEYGLAVRSFQGALTRAPEAGANRLASLYGLATTWNLRRPGDNPELAAQLYRQVISLAPTNDFAAWSWLALARMKALPLAGVSPEMNEQMIAYQEVIDRFPFHPAGEEAFMHQQAARLEQPDEARSREALEALELFIKTHPQSPWRNAAYGLAAHCCQVLGLKEKQFEASIQAWKTAESDRLNPMQDESWTYWQIATVAEFEVGDFDLAREYYRKFIAGYPHEQRVFLAKQELKRMDDLEAGIRGREAGGEEQRK